GSHSRRSLDFLVRFASRQNERRQASVRCAAVKRTITFLVSFSSLALNNVWLMAVKCLCICLQGK
ncbi:hypothetical protein, partial [Dysgonomonas sp. 216]|uniref:hypothetical protein n=1 Tax=Dysgonomonas sp. 216 TaxID=2302934 RepID=UPI001C8696BE